MLVQLLQRSRISNFDSEQLCASNYGQIVPESQLGTERIRSGVEANIRITFQDPDLRFFFENRIRIEAGCEHSISKKKSLVNGFPVNLVREVVFL